MSASTTQGGHKQQTTALSSKAARRVMALNWFCQAIGQIYLDDTIKQKAITKQTTGVQRVYYFIMVTPSIE